MSRAAPGRGPDPIGEVLRYQLLWHRVAVAQAGGAEVLSRLRPLVAAGATQELEASREMRYEVAAVDGGFAVREEGDLLCAAAGAAVAAAVVAERALERALELAALKGWVRVHGALARVSGRRVLAIGPPGSGKTALALRLALREGGGVEGDESVLLREGVAMAVPLPLMIGTAGGGGGPEVPPRARAAARALGDGGSVLDPASDLGLSWRLAASALDHVFVLDPRPGRAGARAISEAEMVSELGLRLAPASLPPRALATALTQALAGASCHRLRVGDGEEMERAVAAVSC